MAAVGVIPCLAVKDGRGVKGVHFVDLMDTLDPLEAAYAIRSPRVAKRSVINASYRIEIILFKI
jgi:imidazole glycerol phosphate synthase subunit HisF